MQVELIEYKTGLVKKAEISIAKSKDIPSKRDGWKFTWRKLFKIEGGLFYKICLEDTPGVIEGMLMLTVLFDEVVYMNNVEIAPHNYGRDGLYENVAGCLIAYACRESFDRGRNDYKGFLSFDSKTELIEFYARKYGATVARGSKMFIDSEMGKELMSKYLKISIT